MTTSSLAARNMKREQLPSYTEYVRRAMSAPSVNLLSGAALCGQTAKRGRSTASAGRYPSDEPNERKIKYEDATYYRYLRCCLLHSIGSCRAVDSDCLWLAGLYGAIGTGDYVIVSASKSSCYSPTPQTTASRDGKTAYRRTTDSRLFKLEVRQEPESRFR
jgi:hypothetical protein